MSLDWCVESCNKIHYDQFNINCSISFNPSDFNMIYNEFAAGGEYTTSERMWEIHMENASLPLVFTLFNSPCKETAGY